MFGISFFSNKVSHHLFRMGYPVKDMPPIQIFKPLCDALKQNGYDAEKAAGLWFRCLNNNDPEAIKELYNNTGAMAKILLGPIEDQEQNAS